MSLAKRTSSTLCQFVLLSSLHPEQAHFGRFASAKPHSSCNVQRSPVHDSPFIPRNVLTSLPVFPSSASAPERMKSTTILTWHEDLCMKAKRGKLGGTRGNNGDAPSVCVPSYALFVSHCHGMACCRRHMSHSHDVVANNIRLAPMHA